MHHIPSHPQEAILKAAPALVKCQEDDEFVANFEKMMSEDMQSRKTEKVPHMDVAVPLHLKGPTVEKSEYPGTSDSSPSSGIIIKCPL